MNFIMLKEITEQIRIHNNCFNKSSLKIYVWHHLKVLKKAFDLRKNTEET